MSDLDRIKHLAGLTMESARGLLQEFKGINEGGSYSWKDGIPDQLMAVISKHNITPDDAWQMANRDNNADIDAIMDAHNDFITRMELEGADTDDDDLYDIDFGEAFMNSPEYGKVMTMVSELCSAMGMEDDREECGAGLMQYVDEGPDDPRSLRFGKAPMRSEAVGDSAECFYNMQDEFAGEEASGAHKVLIDELVRYLSGDQLQDFCDDFRRHHMDGMEESKDLNELRKLAGMGTGTDVPLGGFPKQDRTGMGTGTDVLPPTPDEADEIIKRGKENQIIGKYRPPGSPRDPELDDIISRRAKELEDDPRQYRGIDYGEIKRRMDKIKNEPMNYLDRYKFKWQGNQD